jgi:hypothetical protein
VRIQLLQLGPGTGDYQLWIYPVNRAPENVPATFALNDTIQGEMLENSADIDEFIVTVPAIPDLIAYYQGSGASSAPISMAITGGGHSRLEIFYRPSANLQDLNTGLFWPPAGGTLTVSHSVSSLDQAVLHPYTFMIRRIDRQPELLPAPITAGDSIVGETIGYVGDIDEFPFAGLIGQTVTLSIRAVTGFYPLPVVIELIFPGGGIYEVDARSTNGVLSSTGPIQLPEDGAYLVRVRSLASTVGTGGYEALLQ